MNTPLCSDKNIVAQDTAFVNRNSLKKKSLKKITAMKRRMLLIAIKMQILLYGLYNGILTTIIVKINYYRSSSYLRCIR